MTKEKIHQLIQDLVKFQTSLARKSDPENWEDEQVEEVQNTINILNEYI